MLVITRWSFIYGPFLTYLTCLDISWHFENLVSNMGKWGEREPWDFAGPKFETNAKLGYSVSLVFTGLSNRSLCVSLGFNKREKRRVRPSVPSESHHCRVLKLCTSKLVQRFQASRWTLCATSSRISTSAVTSGISPGIPSRMKGSCALHATSRLRRAQHYASTSTGHRWPFLDSNGCWQSSVSRWWMC